MTKNPAEAGLIAPGGKGTNLQDLTPPIRVSDSVDATHGKDNTTVIKIHNCKINPSVSRRSFCAVGESCVINLIPDPKPDRTYPPSVKLVTLLAPWQCLHHAEGHPAHKACGTYQAV